MAFRKSSSNYSQGGCYTVSMLSLSCTLLFIAVTMLISLKKKLHLEKDIFIGTIRASLQLIAIGYILNVVFSTENIWLYLVIISVMIIVASHNAAKRGQGFRGAMWKIALSIVFIEGFVMLILIGFNIIEPTAQYIIPLSGMTIGNAMVVAGLFLSQLQRESEASRDEIETLLALGASSKQALQRLMSRSVKYSMIPTIDSLKTVGLVQLPGMMTGMIIAGASPVEAVRYQLLILFAFTGAAALTSINLSMLFHKNILTTDLRMEKKHE